MVSREKGRREIGNSQLRQLSGNFIGRKRRERCSNWKMKTGQGDLFLFVVNKFMSLAMIAS